MIVNISEGKINYSQRNNEIKPLESCNVSSMCMALDYLGYTFPKGKYNQPEDNLRAYIESKGWSPEVHDHLSRGTNEWMGKQVTKFSTSVPMDVVVSEILSGRPVVLSGTFPGYPRPIAKPLGHIVCLVGFEWAGNSRDEPVSAAFIDDPYGNTMNNWQGSGNDVRIPWDLFIPWMKPCGSALAKWGHLFLTK